MRFEFAGLIFGCVYFRNFTVALISYPESSGSLASGWYPGDQPLAKEPEDCGSLYEQVSGLVNKHGGHSADSGCVSM